MANKQNRLASILKKHEAQLASAWEKDLAQVSAGDRRLSISEIVTQAKEFLNLVQMGCQTGELSDLNAKEWEGLRSFLEGLSKSRAIQGFTSDQTALFIFSLKKPLFNLLRQELNSDATLLADELQAASEMVDRLGLYTIRAFQKSREEIIARQQEELLELSTPVVKLWEGILALPMIGTLDSSRTQVVMESLLQKIVETGSELAIIDITGVPTVDTLVAQHLLKTVTAIRLMGADCIISGIRPQIAQTIVHLGVDLQGVTTKGSLADALALALKRTNFSITRNKN